VATQFQVTVDCRDPIRLVRFWCEALGYVPEPPPAGFDSWYEFLRSIGMPEREITDSALCDSVIDPDGHGPRIWFQVVPEAKQVKNRLHLDLEIGGGHQVPLPERRRRIEAEAQRLVRAGARRVAELDPDGVEHYAITLADPEGNEFCLH